MYNTDYVNGEVDALQQALQGKAEKSHTHALTDLTGTVPSCTAGKSFPICLAGGLLMVGDTPYAPMPTVGGQPVTVTTRGDLKLGAVAGTWNDIGAFDDVTTHVVTVTGSVTTAVGTFQAINAAGDLQVRVVGGKIQEWHAMPTLAGKTLYLEIRAAIPATAAKALRR